MKEARNAIIIILVLLFIIAGIGVAISRVANRERATNTVKTEAQRGWLERIFLKSKTTKTVEKTTPTAPGTMVITSESETIETPVDMSGSVAGVNTQPPIYTTTGSGSATSIPATGAPIEVILTSLMGLAGGVYLKRKS